MNTIKSAQSTLVLLLVILTTGCAGLMEKVSPSKTIAMVNPSVDTSEGRVIVFPVILLKNGDFSAANTQFDNKALNALLLKSWSSELEAKDTYVVPKTMINTLPGGWEALEVMVRGMDSANLENRLDSDLMKAFYEGINKVAGKGALAVSLVFEDEASYQATKTLHFNAGLFDTETTKFKWITKTIQKPAVAAVPYPAVLQQAIDVSWKKLKEENDGQIR